MRRLQGSTACFPLAVLLAVVTAAACSSSRATPAPAPAASTTTTTRAIPPTSSTRVATAPGPTIPPTIPTTTTTTVAAFRATVSEVTAADLPTTYRAGCPVGPAQLRMLHLGIWGFDGRPHEGTLVVAAGVATPVVEVFRVLYEKRFPIRQMKPEDAYGGSDPASMAADNTSGFNCRAAVAAGPPKWSAHAYGTAIDLNPVENPYLQGGRVQPENGAPFLDRADLRPGMAAPGTVVNDAFAAAGWLWGGRWSGTPDYQHFSASGG